MNMWNVCLNFLNIMNRLKTNICGIEFKNPIIAASGTFGYGLEFKRFTDIEKIGVLIIALKKASKCTSL